MDRNKFPSISQGYDPNNVPYAQAIGFNQGIMGGQSRLRGIYSDIAAIATRLLGDGDVDTEGWFNASGLTTVGVSALRTIPELEESKLQVGARCSEIYGVLYQVLKSRSNMNTKILTGGEIEKLN